MKFRETLGWVLAITFALLAQPLSAQQIKPLDVYQDPNGIDLVSNNVGVAKVPVLSIPAAPELAFSDLADFVPVISVVKPTTTTGMDPDIYTVSAGTVASDAFATCNAIYCTSAKGSGSKLYLQGDEGSPGAGSGGYRYVQGGSGRWMSFDLQTDYYWGTTPQTTKKFLSSRIYNPQGHDLSFEYESASIGGITRHRPTKVTSTAGYALVFTYWSNGTDDNWGFLKKAEIVNVTNPAVVLASHLYQGNTVTDIAGRVFECVCMPNIYGSETPELKGSRLKLPGDANYTFDTSRAQDSNTRTVTSQGVTYTYVSTPDTAWSPTFKAIQDLTITGPAGFSLTVDVTNTPPTTGQFDPPRRRIDSTTDALGRTTRYEYDGVQHLKKIIYPEGNAVEITYDSIGNVLQRKTTGKPGSTPAELIETATYPTSCFGFTCYYPTATTDARLNQTAYTWDARGVLLTELDPADAQGKRRKVKNTWSGDAPIAGETCGTMGGIDGAPVCASRLLREEICETDLNGNELTCGTSQSHVRTFTYFNATSLPATETQTDGAGTLSRTTTYTYDPAGRLLTTNGPMPGSDDLTQSRYDAVGQVTGTIAPDPDGAGVGNPSLATRTTYDLAGRPTKVETGTLTPVDPSTSPANWGSAFAPASTVETAYDVWGRKIADTSKGSDLAAFALTNYSYDAAGRLECTATRMNPAAFGAAPGACTLGASGTQGPDRISRAVYDSAGQLVQTREAVGTSIEIAEATYSYTLNGKREYVIDANGNRAKLSYDGYDRQSSWVFPAAAKPTGFNNSTPATALATAGALNTVDHEDYGYDANGNRTALRKRDGSVLSYGYDNRNRLTIKTVPERSGLLATHTRDVYYTYDVSNQPLSVRFDSYTGEGAAYQYDTLGRKTSDLDTMDGQSSGLLFSYDLDDARTAMQYSDGVSLSFTRDTLGRRTSLSEAGTWLMGHGFDGLGRENAITRKDAVNTNRYFNPAGLLSRLDHYDVTAGDYGHWDYTYNPASQLTSRSVSNDSFAQTALPDKDYEYVSNGLNQYTSAGTQGFCYDANGNLTADGSYAYLYDVENRLVEMRARAGGACPDALSGQLKAALRYDPLGRLHEVVNYINGVAQGPTQFRYDGDDLVTELNGSGAILRRYAHWDNGKGDDPQVWWEGSGVSDYTRRFLLADERGSIVQVNGTYGGTLQYNRYDEYGIPDTTGNVADETATKGRFRYTGQTWIPELAMYYFKARMYSPTIGRFMQVDPIGYVDQTNLYTYVADDPTDRIDPSGTQIVEGATAGCAVGGPACPAGAAVGAAGGVIVVGGSILCASHPSECKEAAVRTVAAACAASTACSALAVSAGMILNNKKGDVDDKRRQSAPSNRPAGTKPIDKAGIDKEGVHRIKKGIGAKPKDWVGVDRKSGEIYTTDPQTGKAVNEGNVEDHDVTLRRVTDE